MKQISERNEISPESSAYTSRKEDSSSNVDGGRVKRPRLALVSPNQRMPYSENQKVESPRKKRIANMRVLNLIREKEHTDSGCRQQDLEGIRRVNQIEHEERKEMHKTSSAYLLMVQLAARQLDQLRKTKKKLEQSNRSKINLKHELMERFATLNTQNIAKERDDGRREYAVEKELQRAQLENRQVKAENEKEKLILADRQRMTLEAKLSLSANGRRLASEKDAFEADQLQHKIQVKKVKDLEIDREESRLQVEVLRLQISPSLKIGFNINREGLSLRSCLKKDMISWDLKTNKLPTVDPREVLFFVIIQLYKNWKKVLRNFSYKADEYKSIFGLSDSFQQSLACIFESNLKVRQSTKKIRRTIAIGAPHFQYYTEIKSYLFDNLSRFKNSILTVNQISILPANGFEEMQIIYTLGNEKKSQTFELYQIKRFVKEELRQLVSTADKTSCVMVCIPMYNQKEDYQRFVALYEYLRRVK